MPRRPIPWKAVIIALGVIVLGIQAVPYGHGRSNPPVLAEPQWDSLETKMLARRACYDCHSNETTWPAYARVAPMSWLVRWDVDEGRAKLNFSEMNRPQEEAGEAVETVQKGEMPLWMYTVLHAEARLTEAERAVLARGLASTLGTGDEESEERH